MVALVGVYDAMLGFIDNTVISALESSCFHCFGVLPGLDGQVVSLARAPGPTFGFALGATANLSFNIMCTERGAVDLRLGGVVRKIPESGFSAFLKCGGSGRPWSSPNGRKTSKID